MTSDIESRARADKVRTSIRRVHFVRRLTFIIPVAILLLLVLSAIFADLGWLGFPDAGIAPYGPTEFSLTERLLPPAWAEGGSTAHLLGTDDMGKDILSRTIHGARISLSISLLVIVITAGIGAVLGIVAGYLGGRTDNILMHITDVSLSFPAILIAILLAASMGPGYWTVVIALSILGWAPYARLIRGEAMRLRGEDFVLQANIIGASPLRVMLRHIFPNIINPLIIMMTLSIGMVILTEAALSYLGAGIPPSMTSWGAMVSDGRDYLDSAWWISTFPGIAIGLVVLSGNFFGDWLRDKMDPRLRQL